MATLKEILELALKVSGEQDAAALSSAIEEIGKASGDSAGKANKLVDELDKLDRVSKLAADFLRTQAALDQTNNELAQAKEGFAALNREFDGTAKRTGEVGKAYKAAETELKRLTAQQEKQQRALDKTGKELQEAGVDTDKLADETLRLDRETAKSTKGLVAQGEALKRSREAAERQAKAYETLGKNVAAARGKLNEIAGSFTKVATLASGAATAVAGFLSGTVFVDAIKDARSFQQVISEVGAVAGASGDDLKRLEEAARSAARESGFGFNETAKALGELARATGDVDRAVAALPATLALARAGGLEVAKAAEIVTTTLTQFGLSADNSSRVADLLAQAANSTTSSVEQLGNSLSYAAPLARQLGLEVEPTVAIIGALADQGFRGERAGTALRNVFSALADPASKFSKALDAAGIKSRDFTTVIQQLAARADGGRKVFLALDSEARPAIIALARDGGSAIRKLEVDLKGAEGQAARTAAAMRDNLAGASDTLGLSLDNIRQEFLKPLLAPLTDELQGLSAAIDDFAKSPEFEALRQAFKNTFLEGIEAAKEFVRETNFTEAAANIRRFVEGAKTDIASLGSAAGEIVAVVKGFAAGLDALFNALQTGITGAAAAAAAAVATLARAAVAVLELQQQLQDATPGAKGFADAVGFDLTESLERVRGVAAEAQDAATKFGEETVTQARQTRDAANDLGTAFTGVGTAAEEGFGKAAVEIENIGPVAAKALEGMKAETAGIAEATKGLSNELAKAVAKSADLALQLQKAIAGGESQENISRLRGEFSKANAEVGQLEKGAKTAGEEVKKAGEKGAQAVAPVAKEAKKAREEFQGASNAAHEMGKLSEEGARLAGGATAAVTALLAQLHGEFTAVSKTAHETFVTMQRGAFGVGKSIEAGIEATVRAADETRRQINSQRLAAEELIRQYDAFGEAGEQAADRAGIAFNASEASLRSMADAARAGGSELRLLGQADLDRLAAAADRAADKIARIRQESESAVAELDQLNRQLQDKADARAGNEEAIAQRRFEDELARIDEVAARAGEAGRVQADEARRRLQEEYDAELALIRRNADEKARQAKASASSGGAQPSRSSDSGASGGARLPTGGNTFNNYFTLGPGTTDQQVREIARKLKELEDRS